LPLLDSPIRLPGVADSHGADQLGGRSLGGRRVGAERMRRARLGRSRTRGQTLVEFALVFPLFFTMFLGFVEFAFVFNAVLSVNFASRNAALAAAEAGNATGADCVILVSVDKDVSAPANQARITQIDIYRANSNGTPYSPAMVTTWTRGGSSLCTYPDGTVVPGGVPYTRTLNGYKETNRCSVLAGCPTDITGVHPGVDYVGVRVYYTHPFVTPVKTFVASGGSISFDRTNVMRLEPVL
jgi:Flp pilus assembly protein TadG